MSDSVEIVCVTSQVGITGVHAVRKSIGGYYARASLARERCRLIAVVGERTAR
jgi:hypothetical protein